MTARSDRMYCISTLTLPSPRNAVISLRGEIDLTASSDLRRAVDRVIDQGCRSITLDLSGVSFMDCAGLTALLSCRDVSAESGGRLRLGRLSQAAARLLRLTGPHDGWTTGNEADRDPPSHETLGRGCQRHWHADPRRRVVAARHPRFG